MDYRQAFVNALDGSGQEEIQDVVDYARDVQEACWGALYKRFLQTVSGPDALTVAVERFCAAPNCDRFLLLLLHQRRGDSEAIAVFVHAAAKLPVMAHAYLLCLLDRSARENLAAESLHPECRALLDDAQARTRERQVLEARIAKLLRLEFAGSPAPRSQRPNAPTSNAIEPSLKPQEAP